MIVPPFNNAVGVVAAKRVAGKPAPFSERELGGKKLFENWPWGRGVEGSERGGGSRKLGALHADHN